MENSFLSGTQFKIINGAFVALIFFGIIGNSLNMIVFGKKIMRDHLTFKILLVLSTIDFVILIFCATEAVLNFFQNINIRDFHVVICKVDSFIFYYFTQTRNFFTMSLTILRANIVSKIYKTQRMAIAKNTNRSDSTSEARQFWALHVGFFKRLFSWPIRKTNFFILIFLSLFLINVHFILFHTINYELVDIMNEANDSVLNQNFDFKNQMHKKLYYACSPLKGSSYEYFLHNIFFWVDAFVYFCLPFASMTISFVLILFIVIKSNQRYSNFIKDDSYKANSKIYFKKIEKNKKIILILTVINSYFFFTIFPYFLFNIFVLKIDSENKMVLKLLSNVLFFSNNSLNILFYGFSSQKYRNEFFKLFGKNRN